MVVPAEKYLRHSFLAKILLLENQEESYEFL